MVTQRCKESSLHWWKLSVVPIVRKVIDGEVDRTMYVKGWIWRYVDVRERSVGPQGSQEPRKTRRHLRNVFRRDLTLLGPEGRGERRTLDDGHIRSLQSSSREEELTVRGWEPGLSVYEGRTSSIQSNEEWKYTRVFWYTKRGSLYRVNSKSEWS